MFFGRIGIIVAIHRVQVYCNSPEKISNQRKTAIKLKGEDMYNPGISIKFPILISVILFMTGCESKVVQPADIGDIEVSFKSDLIPIFNRSCVSCHETADDPPPILVSDVAYQKIIAGGYVVPGNAEESLFYKRIIGDPDIRGGRTMPPGEKLPDAEIELIKQWIKQGAQNN